MRQHCQNNGLFLSAHALLVTQPDRPLYLRDKESGRTIRIPQVGGTCPVEVPYEYLRTEADVLWLVGGGSKRFFGLLDPRHRNA